MKEVKSNFISHKDANVFVEEDTTGLYPEGCHHYFLTECLGWDNENSKTAFLKAGVHGLTKDQLQEIVFVSKDPKLNSVSAGVTSEQLLILLMHRHQQMNEAFPSIQNEEFITHLQSALDLLEQRVKDRVNRGVMGDLKK